MNKQTNKPHHGKSELRRGKPPERRRVSEREYEPFRARRRRPVPIRSRAGQRNNPIKPPERIRTHRRGRAINRSVSVVAGIFFFFVAAYLLRSLYAFITTPHIPTETIKLGSVEVPFTVKGIIIRDEYVYTADRAGRLAFNVGDYERVKSGMDICSVQNLQAVEDITKSMLSIEEQIIELQQMRRDISGIDPAVSRINAQIKNIVDGRLYHFTTFNTAEVYTLKESVSQIINTRNQMILDDNKNIKEELSLEQQQLMNRLNTHVSTIAADRSGIVSPVVDGLESVLTFETMKELTKEQTQMTVDYNKIIPPKDVEAEAPVFKIIASNKWYIATYIPNDLVEGYEDGDTRIIYLETAEDYQPMYLKVERIDQGYRESFVLFECTKNIIDYLNTRNITLKTTDSVRKGYKISNTAITTRTFFTIPLGYLFESDKNYVIKLTEEGEVIVPVAVSEMDDEYAYVLTDGVNLAIMDEIKAKSPIGAPHVLTDTLSIQGVYRVNNGFAEFRKITLDTELSTAENLDTGGYTVLNPTLNKGLKIYDNIVTDASGITDGQILH